MGTEGGRVPEGDTGHVYEGLLDFEKKQIELDSLPKIPVKIMMNVGNPDRAFDFASIPNHGVGLARLEFIINRMIGVHPKALLEFQRLDPELQAQIRTQMAGYPDPVTSLTATHRPCAAEASIASQTACTAAPWPNPGLHGASGQPSSRSAT